MLNVRVRLIEQGLSSNTRLTADRISTSAFLSQNLKAETMRSKSRASKNLPSKHNNLNRKQPPQAS
jgi:hypothetical protein